MKVKRIRYGKKRGEEEVGRLRVKGTTEKVKEEKGKLVRGRGR